MKKHKSILSLSLGLAALFTAAPSAPLHAGEEVRTISPELFAVLESWSDHPVTLESLALESHPEVLEAYLPEVEAFHGGVSLLEHFADAYPASHAAFLDAVGRDSEEATSSLEFLAFVMGRADRDYYAWQAELSRRGLNFEKFVNGIFNELEIELRTANTSPADQGIGLLDYIGADADEALFTEAQTVLASAKAAGGDCACWTVVTFPRSPLGWTTEIDEHYLHTGNPWRRLDYTVGATGAARQVDFARQITRNLWEVTRDKASNQSGMRVRMQCTQGGSPNGVACTGPTCQGEIAARVGYSSRVYEEVTVGGIWSRQSRHLTADLAVLTYDPPGPAPVATLFSKGLAVAGETQNTWNAGPIASLLYVGGQIAMVVANDGSNVDQLLTQDMMNTTVNGIAGVVTRSGSPGSLSRDMMVAWDTSSSSPIALLPNETHIFELDTASKMYSRGYGGQSRSEGHLGSANYLVSVTRNYHCAAGVQAPTPRANWVYARGGDAPYSKPTMQGFIGTFVATELGVYPPAIAPIGQFP